jgi:hypothetical protein
MLTNVYPRNKAIAAIQMRIPDTEKALVMLRSAILTLLVPAMVRFLPLPRVFSILRSKSRLRKRSLRPEELAQMARAAVRFAPHFGVGECLIRSLILYNLLHCADYSPVLFIGARVTGGNFDCHCWIEVDGNMLCESNDPRERFKLLYSSV